MAQITNIVRLSFRDYSHEWRMSGCFILALASVLAPMMILFGLKFGIVTTMVDELVENPANREIRPIGSGRYDDAWIEAFRNRDDVEFIIPKTRALAATIQLKSDKAKRILSTELMATAAGDPLLRGLSSVPRDYYQVVLSQSAANKLKVKSGDQIDASLARQGIPAEDRRALRTLLEECDQVRFAPVLPDVEAMNTACDRASDLIVRFDETLMAEV